MDPVDEFLAEVLGGDRPRDPRAMLAEIDAERRKRQARNAVARRRGIEAFNRANLQQTGDLAVAASAWWDDTPPRIW